MQVSELIDRASKTLGSQAKLAKHIGAQPSHVSEWKTGARPCPEEALLKMASIVSARPIDTVMEVIRDRLGKLVTMSLAGAAVTLLGLTPRDADAHAAGLEPSVHYV